MPPSPEPFDYAPGRTALRQGPALLRAWYQLLGIGLAPGLSRWERKRVRLLNGIAGIALAYEGRQAPRPAFAATLPPVAVVPQDRGRVLINLFTNGFHAVRQREQQAGEPGSRFRPKLVVTTRAVPGAVEIRMRDSGPGMSDQVRQKIFQPFFTTKPTGQGTGLGLSLSFDIVAKGRGGTSAVSGIEGVGTEFIIRLPQA